MRLNLIIMLLVIAALGAGGFFTVKYFQRANAADDLEQQVQNTNTEVQKLTASNESLTTDAENLKKAQASVQTALESQNPVPAGRPDSTEIIRSMMQLGFDNGTSITPLRTTDWTTEKVQQSEYRVFRMNFKIEGAEPNIVNFIRYLQDLYPVMVIESCQVGPAGTGQASGTASPAPAETDDRFSSTLGIAIYAR